MRFEIPEPRRCCFCLPLRYGLIFWIYLKLGFATFILFEFAMEFINLIFLAAKFEMFLTFIVVVVSGLEIAFCILFLISAHLKNPGIMIIYFRCSIAILIMEVIAFLGMFGITVRMAVLENTIYPDTLMVYLLIFLFLLIVLQVYLIILVRSEVLKRQKQIAENNVQFECVNLAGESVGKVEIIP